MSSFLTPIAVDLKDVTKAVGSKDMKLLKTLIDDFGTEFVDIDELITDNIDDDEADEAPTTEDLLRHLIMGEPRHEELGFAYGYAFEFICLHFGDALPNGEWCSMHYTWIGQLDKELQRIGVDPQVLTITNLVFGGAPVDLPSIDETPAIGHRRLRDIKAALKELTPERLASVSTDEMRTSFEELQSWLETCAESKCDLVTFYV